MARMERCFSTSDTAAVKLSGNVVLAGIGKSVHVFSIQQKKLFSRREVLCAHKVRDLSLNSDGRVLVYGGKELAVFKLRQDGEEFGIADPFSWAADDCIVHAKWLECNEIATMSGHNVVTIWNSNGVLKYSVKCQERSILRPTLTYLKIDGHSVNLSKEHNETCGLMVSIISTPIANPLKNTLRYSGYLIGDKCDDLVCFAGTVRGEVVIWPVNTKNPDTACEPMHYLRGHRGAIFCIRYDPVSSMICTTSDDRSVRWWHKSSRVEGRSLYESWRVAQISQISVGHGHLSRVWKCFISPFLTFTAGEDSQLCVWKNMGIIQILLNEARQETEFPLMIRKQILHGGSFWDVDFSPDDGLLALGLEDGGVRVWALNSLLPQASILAHSPLGRGDPSRKVCLFGKLLQPIVISKNGSVFIRKGPDNSSPNWQNAYQKSYLGLCLLESSLNKKSVALTSSDGSLDILSGFCPPEEGSGLKLLTSLKLEGDYMLSLHWLANDLLLTCRSKGQLQLWHLCPVEGDSKTLNEVMRWTLPHSKQCWTTAATWIPWGEPPGLVLCGNRAGDLLLYSKDSPGPVQIIKHLHGLMGVTSLIIFWPTCNQDKRRMPTYLETYVQPQEQGYESARNRIFCAEIYSTGRDGIVNIFKLREGMLKLKGKEKLGFEWAARFLVRKNNILVFGFKGAAAVIWGIKERCILLEKNCGGGHRSWDVDFISYRNGSLGVHLAMVKKGELVTVDWNLPPRTLGESVLQDGLHSREINCVRCFNWSDYFSNVSQGMALVLTGSEDTTAKVSGVSYDGDEISSPFFTLNAFHGHLSSIRAISILPLHPPSSLDVVQGDGPSNSLEGAAALVEENACAMAMEKHIAFMVFSAGGRAQIKAWKLSFDQAENQSNSYPSHQHSRVKEKMSLTLDYENTGSNMESRIMDVQSFYPSGMYPGNSCDILVAVVAACSDGLLRIFGYKESLSNPANAELKPYLGVWSVGIPCPQITKRHCLIKVLHTSFCGRNVVITTDCVGYYHLWDVTGELQSLEASHGLLGQRDADIQRRNPFNPFFDKLSHQFSINAIDWRQLNVPVATDEGAGGDSSQGLPLLLVATGGEDGALSIDLLELQRSVSGEDLSVATVKASWKQELAEATQIAGVKFYNDKYLVTASKFQEVTLWKWCYDSVNNSLSASMLSSCSSSISDIEDIDVVTTRDGVLVVVCGCGLELVRIITADE